MAQICSRWAKTRLVTVARCEEAAPIDKAQTGGGSCMARVQRSMGGCGKGSEGMYVEAASEGYVQATGRM
jgi:hypothetical protein